MAAEHRGGACLHLHGSGGGRGRVLRGEGRARSRGYKLPGNFPQRFTPEAMYLLPKVPDKQARYPLPKVLGKPDSGELT